MLQLIGWTLPNRPKADDQDDQSWLKILNIYFSVPSHVTLETTPASHPAPLRHPSSSSCWVGFKESINKTQPTLQVLSFSSYFLSKITNLVIDLLLMVSFPTFNWNWDWNHWLIKCMTIILAFIKWCVSICEELGLIWPGSISNIVLHWGIKS